MPTANPAAEEAPPPGLSGAFAFVSQLAQEVSCGKIELPSFPDVAVRVRKVLADEHVSNEQIARVVGSEDGLAARAHRQDSLSGARGGIPLHDSGPDAGLPGAGITRRSQCLVTPSMAPLFFAISAGFPTP